MRCLTLGSRAAQRRGNVLQGFKDFDLNAKARDLTLTVLHVPYLLDSDIGDVRIPTKKWCEETGGKAKVDVVWNTTAARQVVR